jgi:hypothetical protein
MHIQVECTQIQLTEIDSKPEILIQEPHLSHADPRQKRSY